MGILKVPQTKMELRFDLDAKQVSFLFDMEQISFHIKFSHYL